MADDDRRLKYPDTPDLTGLTGATVSKWELFKSHPRVDVMSMWARAVDLRLIVELDDVKGKRLPVMLHAHTSEIARAIDSASDADREFIRKMLERMEILGD